MGANWQNHGTQSTIKRYGALFLAHTLVKPMLKLLEMTGNYTWFNRLFIQKAKEYKASLNFGAYQATEHDIFVCCYAKSGTNWMMQITYQIAHLGNGKYESIHDVIAWPDGMRGIVPLDDPTPLANSPTGLRVIKTHLNWDKVPYSPDARYIAVVRDPKDVFVSSYHFAKSVALGVLMPSPKTWLESFLSEAFFFDSWAEHTAGYWANRDKDNVLVLTFAEMKADLSESVKKVTDFMGVELSQEALEQVVEKSSFAYMKNIDHKFYPGAVSPFADGNGRMMRKGQNGSSNELLSTEDRIRIDDYMRAKLHELGSDFPYDELFA